MVAQASLFYDGYSGIPESVNIAKEPKEPEFDPVALAEELEFELDQLKLLNLEVPKL
jgi:hypothetical protein